MISTFWPQQNLDFHPLASARPEPALTVQVLGVSDLTVSADVPLMESGIDSLGATERSARLGTQFQIDVSSTAMFEHPTPRALAVHVQEHFIPSAVARGAPTHVAATTTVAGTSLQVLGVLGRWAGGSNDHVAERAGHGTVRARARRHTSANVSVTWRRAKGGASW